MWACQLTHTHMHTHTHTRARMTLMTRGLAAITCSHRLPVSAFLAPPLYILGLPGEVPVFNSLGTRPGCAHVGSLCCKPAQVLIIAKSGWLLCAGGQVGCETSATSAIDNTHTTHTHRTHHTRHTHTPVDSLAAIGHNALDLVVDLMPACPGDGFIIPLLFWDTHNLHISVNQVSPTTLGFPWWTWLGQLFKECLLWNAVIRHLG